MKFVTTYLLSICLSFVAIITAHTAETSRAHVLGFNEDGRYFVFEEYGIADGIGVPYVTIFAIDTKTDQWVKGSPARIEAREEDMDETYLRTQPCDSSPLASGRYIP